MAVLLKTSSVRVSFIQIMQVRVQNKGKSVWKNRYDRDVSITCAHILMRVTLQLIHCLISLRAYRRMIAMMIVMIPLILLKYPFLMMYGAGQKLWL